MIGSSAARHLAESGWRIAVVAAPEPPDWTLGDGPFSSHYDAGRITRVMSPDPIWAELAHRSMLRYSDIEDRSGIQFHDQRGLAWAGVDLSGAVASATDRGVTAKIVTRDWLYATTGIRVPEQPGLQVAYEPAPAGTINPRELIRAQLVLAELAGAAIVAGSADRLAPSRRGSGFEVQGRFGTVTADRVLVATGPYGGELVGVELDFEVRLRTTVRVDMGPAPEMPSLIIHPVPNTTIGDIYWVPPVLYPDGRTLFKIGGDLVEARLASTAAEINSWFTGPGDSTEADALFETARALLPTKAFRSWDTVPCAVTKSASEYPYIDWVDDGVAVAVSGCGAAAKSCDEIGRLAAGLISGDPDPLITAGTFTARIPSPGSPAPTS